MTTSNVRYVGLDVHKRVVEACIVDHRGKVVHRERFALNRRTLNLFDHVHIRPCGHRYRAMTQYALHRCCLDSHREQQRRTRMPKVV